MQSTTTQGVRHLLVSTGVISVVLSVAAPAALAAGSSDQPGEVAPVVLEQRDKTWVCHQTGSDTNPWELVHVSENAAGHDGHDGDVEIEQDDIVAALATWNGVGDAVLTSRQATLRHLDEDQLEAVSKACQVAFDVANPVVVKDPVVKDRVVVKDPVVEVLPATPVQPIPPAAETKPIVIISTDTVTRPVTVVTPAMPAIPASPATPIAPVVQPQPAVPAPPAEPSTTVKGATEVLGVSTTRTPTVGAGVLDPGARTPTLAATGLDGTAVLAVLGSVLLLSGVGMELLGRKRSGARA